jgi:hypothetical protein
MASTGYELLPWATLSFTLFHKVIHGSLHIFHVQRATLSNQLMDVKFAEPSRACVVRNIQRVYACVAHQLSRKKERRSPWPTYILVTHKQQELERKLSESDHGDRHV